MTKGFEINSYGFKIWNEDRIVFDTTGELINVSNAEYINSFSAVFPDAQKNAIRLWSYSVEYRALVTPPYLWECYGMAAVGAQNQEWSNIIDLGPAPSGANMFLGKAQITRTVSPTTTWAGTPLDAPPFNGQWVPINGSMILEQALGISRAMSIYIADGSPTKPGTIGNLVAFLQHSVSNRMGGYRQWGTQLVPANTTTSGGENQWTGPNTTGFSVYFPPTDGSSPAAKSSAATTSNFTGGTNSVAAGYRRHRWDGTDPPVYSDPTNYSSTYSVNLSGRFARAVF